jgi:hypothetical protein
MDGILSVLSVLESAKKECVEKCQREAREHKEWLEKALSGDEIRRYGNQKEESENPFECSS